MMSEPYSIQLKQQPCVVSYIDKWSSFLVGTYELLPTIEDARRIWPDTDIGRLAYNCEFINYRTGSLVLFSQTEGSDKFEIKETVRCQYGGVFDFTVRDDEIYVAHSNNTITIYDYVGSNKDATCDNKKLVYRTSFQPTPDSSILLTSIDTCSFKIPDQSCDRFYTAIGDSKARVTILRDEYNRRLGRVVDKRFVSDKANPVWQVRFVQPTENETISTLYLIVGCENRAWFVFGFDVKSQRLIQLALNHGFGAGVTSICILPSGKKQSYAEQEVDVLLGSYDETLRKYRISLDATKAQPAIECIEEVLIKGGGIWRVTLRGDLIYIAAMYAGCYKANWADIKSTLTNLTKDVDSAGALDYGIDVCQSQGIACVADYNNKLCLFFNP